MRSLIILALSLITAISIADAAPLRTKGRKFATAPLASSPLEGLTCEHKLFTPVTELPGTIGSFRYNSDGRCIVIVLGGSPTNSDMLEILSKSGSPVLNNFAGSHTVYMCPGANGGTDVTVLNYRAFRQAFKGRSCSSKPGTTLVSSWNHPNLLASATLGNKVKKHGVTFISNEYELVFGTDDINKPYFVVIDRVAHKLAYYTDANGGYYSDLSPEMVTLYNTTVGAQALLAPKIVLFNN
ncbi:MAG: hypothetical protein RL417_685 [Pseudomonadota bacterium]|jgi:hypothetical protein